MGRHVCFGATSLTLSLLILGFSTRIPASLAYLVSFFVATMLGYCSFWFDRHGREVNKR